MASQPSLLTRTDPSLDDMPIHVGDIVHLLEAGGSTVKARVIYNAPLNGSVIYTTEPVTRVTESGRVLKLRFRFRHEHVHCIEPVRGEMPDSSNSLSCPSQAHPLEKSHNARKLTVRKLTEALHSTIGPFWARFGRVLGDGRRATDKPLQ